MKVLVNNRSHVALQHMFMGESFPDARMFNISADMEVNSYIENLPQGGATAASVGQQLGIHIDEGQGTKYYYGLLTKQKQQQNNAQNPSQPCNGGQGGNSPSQSSSPSEADSDDTQQDNGSQKKEEPPSSPQQEKQPKKPAQQYPDEFKDNFEPIDDHDTWKTFRNLPEANKQLITNNINAVLKQTAEQIEKGCGHIPGNLVEVIAKLKEKKPEVFNWKAYFRRLLGSIYDVNIRSTRRKESKRFEGAAGIQHKKKVSILVAVDTSGSVSDKELQEFFSEIDYVYKAGARVTIIECDTQINSITEYDGRNLPKIHGRGGTEFDPPVDYYVEHKKEYASLIYFTDGEACMPRKRPSGMVWVISSRGSHQEYPGKTVYIPKSKD